MRVTEVLRDGETDLNTSLPPLTDQPAPVPFVLQLTMLDGHVSDTDRASATVWGLTRASWSKTNPRVKPC